MTLVPYLVAAGELKTKPTQQSVAKLSEIGIQPQVLVCRCDHPLDSDLRDKLSLFCNVPVKAVIECRDVAHSIYELPLALQKGGNGRAGAGLPRSQDAAGRRTAGSDIVRRMLTPRHEVTIGVVGKYIELQDAYKSVYESVTHGGIANNCKVNVRRIDAEELEKKGGSRGCGTWTASWFRAVSGTGAQRARSRRPATPGSTRYPISAFAWASRLP